MTALYTCITGKHDLNLVILAALICALGVYSTFSLAREVLRTDDRRDRILWSVAAVVATSSAIWATHFIAMIAFEPGLPIRFGIARTVASYLLALSLVGLGAVTLLTVKGAGGRLLGGAIVGFAISAMHYTGMSALQMKGDLFFNFGPVTASILSGVGLAALAALLPLSRHRFLRALGPAALLLAVCSAHFIGMSAVTIVYNPRALDPEGAVNIMVLAILVANVAVVIMGLSLAALWLRVRESRQRQAEQDRLQDFADVAIEGLLVCDGLSIAGLNSSLELMTGRSAREMVGLPIVRLLPGLSVPVSLDGTECDATLLTAKEECIPVKVAFKRIVFRGRTQTVVGIRDQRDRLRTEADMTRLARCDVLTGLANRMSFGEAVTARCSSRRKDDDSFAFLMLDLDRFKTVNDTLGHAAGDEVLRQVAARLGELVRDGDIVARLGGDEFAILVERTGGTSDIVAIIERIVGCVGQPFVIEDQIVDLGLSLGVALAPADGETLEVLSRNADLALYRAKDEGRGTYRFFEPAMNDRMQARRKSELDLRRAIERQEFEVVYQPQVDARYGTYQGAEALVRWNHPQSGTVPTAEFIPLAEELGLISAIGHHVLRAACTEAALWTDHLSVAVNVSPVQLRDRHFATSVASILSETGLSPHRLELELTENALLQDDGLTLDILHTLRDLGIRISMDDFGTGYSSLSYLRRFPFDKIKIDQSFVRQLPGDPDSVAIVQAVATLGAKLGMTVTAEGIETLEQRSFAVAEGCDQLQGYLFSKPVSAALVADLFMRGLPCADAA